MVQFHIATLPFLQNFNLKTKKWIKELKNTRVLFQCHKEKKTKEPKNAIVNLLANLPTFFYNVFCSFACYNTYLDKQRVFSYVILKDVFFRI